MPVKYIVLIALFGLLGCSNQPAVTSIPGPVERQAAASSFTPAAEPQNSSETNTPPKDESPVKVIGDFSNQKGDGEHCYGYSVELWKQDEKMYGLISAQEFGLCGDTPAGLLEDIQFDPQTKKISFRAKLSMGLYYDANNSNVPSQDVFEFDGVLKAKKLNGMLKITNELCSDKCPETKKITLPKSKEWSSLLEEYKSRAEWEANAKRILDRRGPRW